MLYVCEQTGKDKYKVWDTIDYTYSFLTKQEVLKLNKGYKVYGVIGDDVKVFNPFKAYYKWKLLGVLDQKLDSIDIKGFFYDIYDCLMVDEMGDGLVLYRDTEEDEYWYSDTLKDMKDIEIPDGITYIDEDCFKGLSNLETVKLPNSLLAIGHEAFSGCKNLKEINIPDNFKSFGAGVFNNCINLKHIKVPSKFKINDLKSVGLKYLETVTIGNKTYKLK